MARETSNCQTCGAELNPGWHICHKCRKEYARQLHDLRINLRKLESKKLRKYKLGEGGGSGDGFAPAGIDLGAGDLEDEIQRRVYDIAATINLWAAWGKLIPAMLGRMAQLCQVASAGESYRTIVHLNQRIEERTERKRVKPFVGRCLNCGHDVTADTDEHGAVCKCGHWLDLDSMRQETREQWERMHTTQTPKGAAEWVTRHTGIKVTRKDVTNWLLRGKLHAERLEGGYYELLVGELVELAQSKTQ
ncbi:hypothetical protein CRD60_00980 [Bifidobacterium aemilianum]|uniref:PhnA protein n=1 Tax=Bifidobacterium aemilianum TaxID=2493120 RepID=A0A366K9P8_9BIFI|nr:hypothetical protein [Bifidobacterium aemilianum]RBP98470.1 hypothetical protein CRD60_00980 [Bifidobacterium aemilianum]